MVSDDFQSLKKKEVNNYILDGVNSGVQLNNLECLVQGKLERSLNVQRERERVKKEVMQIQQQFVKKKV